DAAGNVTTYVRDGQGRILSETQTNSSTGTTLTTGYTYDSYGNKTSETDPDGSIQHWTYDPTFHNEVSSYSDQLGNVTTYTYDSHGNQTSVTLAADTPL